MWDLDQNLEVAFINRPSELSTSQNFVGTGFQLYSFLNNDIDEISYTSQNEDMSLVLTAKIN